MTQSSGHREREAHVACVEATWGGHSTAAQPQRCCPGRAVPQLDVPAAPGCPTSAATWHLPRATTQPPAAKIHDGTEPRGGFSFYFFKDSSLKPPKPLDRAQFCSQNYLKISSNLEWESTKTCTYFVFKTAATFLFQIWNFIHFFSSLITQAGQGFHME